MLLACLLTLAGCGAIAKLMPGHVPTTRLSSLRVAAPPGANLNSAVALDVVFVYNATATAMLPKTAPEWFSQKTALMTGLGRNVDVVSLQIPPATVVDTVRLPDRAGKAIGVYTFANYQSKDGQARGDITTNRHAVIWLAASQIAVTEQ